MEAILNHESNNSGSQQSVSTTDAAPTSAVSAENNLTMRKKWSLLSNKKGQRRRMFRLRRNKKNLSPTAASILEQDSSDDGLLHTPSLISDDDDESSSVSAEHGDNEFRNKHSADSRSSSRTDSLAVILEEGENETTEHLQGSSQYPMSHGDYSVDVGERGPATFIALQGAAAVTPERIQSKDGNDDVCQTILVIPKMALQANWLSVIPEKEDCIRVLPPREGEVPKEYTAVAQQSANATKPNCSLLPPEKCVTAADPKSLLHLYHDPYKLRSTTEDGQSPHKRDIAIAFNQPTLLEENMSLKLSQLAGVTCPWSKLPP